MFFSIMGLIYIACLNCWYLHLVNVSTCANIYFEISDEYFIYWRYILNNKYNLTTGVVAIVCFIIECKLL